jgi:hypothetical protein
MRTVKAGTSLATGLAMTDLDLQAYWLRYFGLGGSYSRPKLQAYLAGDVTWSAHEHDVAAHALNEYFSDHGMDHPVLYADDL